MAYSQTQLSKEIKRINFRLTEWEKRGLENTREYKETIKKAETLGLELGKTRSGFTKIVNRKGYSPEKKLGVTNIEKKFKTVAKAEKESRERLEKKGIEHKNLTREEVIEMVEEQKDKTHNFIVEHAKDIYLFSDLTSWVRRGTKLTEEEEKHLLNMYEERKDELKEIALKKNKKKNKLLGIDEVSGES